jgi:hypothetical protein
MLTRSASCKASAPEPAAYPVSSNSVLERHRGRLQDTPPRSSMTSVSFTGPAGVTPALPGTQA